MSRTIVMKSLDDLDVIANIARVEFEKYGKVSVTIGEFAEDEKSRSAKQNRLAFLWYKHAAFVMEDETAEAKRAYCKLHFGVPIRRENEAFREVYDRVIRPLNYAQKLEIMVGAIDFPVSRDMSVKEMARYLEAVEVFYTGLGVDLPKPDDLYRIAMGGKIK